MTIRAVSSEKLASPFGRRRVEGASTSLSYSDCLIASQPASQIWLVPQSDCSRSTTIRLDKARRYARIIYLEDPLLLERFMPPQIEPAQLNAKRIREDILLHCSIAMTQQQQQNQY